MIHNENPSRKIFLNPFPWKRFVRNHGLFFAKTKLLLLEIGKLWINYEGPGDKYDGKGELKDHKYCPEQGFPTAGLTGTQEDHGGVEGEKMEGRITSGDKRNNDH